MTKKQGLKVWQIPVTRKLDELVTQAVDLDTHVSRSDYVREAVRAKLRLDGLLNQNSIPGVVVGKDL